MPVARFQRVPKSDLDHKSHRKFTEVSTSWCPLLLLEGRTHFGSMRSLSQASSEFSSTTCLNVAERTRANEGLDFLGTNRNVGRVTILGCNFKFCILWSYPRKECLKSSSKSKYLEH